MQKSEYATFLQQEKFDMFLRKIKPLLDKIYDDKDIVERLLEQIVSLVENRLADTVAENLNLY